jgi:hypothetical protein
LAENGINHEVDEDYADNAIEANKEMTATGVSKTMLRT